MKRFAVIIALLCFMAFSAGAQWYLFPGGGNAHASDTVTAVTPQSDTSAAPEAGADTQEPDVLKLALVLPFFNGSVPSVNFLEFYSGALMAVKEIGERGVSAVLNVFNSADVRYDSSFFNSADLVVGPVQTSDLSLAAMGCPDDIFIVSPLDPKAQEMVTGCNVIQAPSMWQAQIDELVEWLAEETRGNDSVVLLQNDMEEAGESSPYLVSRMNDCGIVYSIAPDMETAPKSMSGCTRYVLMSENSTFCADCVRDIALAAVKGESVALYSNSKLRSVSDLDAASLHSAGARITATYYADPENPDVAAFDRAYLASFHAEPTSFSYQGYDLVRYFMSLCSMYGRGWSFHLTEHPWDGLQTSFRFKDSVCAGRINTAVRRLRYRDNNVITVEKQ